MTLSNLGASHFFRTSILSLILNPGAEQAAGKPTILSNEIKESLHKMGSEYSEHYVALE
jgi:hypothetical protein